MRCRNFGVIGRLKQYLKGLDPLDMEYDEDIFTDIELFNLVGVCSLFLGEIVLGEATGNAKF